MMRTDITLKDYPVYPLYDDIVLHRGHTAMQVQWLVDNGTLYRSLPIYSGRAITTDRLFCTAQSTLQEIFRHEDRHGVQYYFAEYDPEYRGDDPDPRHAIARRYISLARLFQCESVTNLAGLPDNIAQPCWHWLHHQAALLSANGELVCYQNTILYAIDGVETRS